MNDAVAAQLAEDRRLYGESFECVKADGSRHRIDPRRVTLQLNNCPRCKGRGWITLPFPVLGAPNGVDPPCNDCNGTGILP